MKRVCFIILLLLLGAGCGYGNPAIAPARILPAASPTGLASVPAFTLAILPVDSPTPALPDFTEGLAPTLDQFTKVSKNEFPVIMDYLASQTSFLTLGSPAPYITQVFHPRSGEDYFLVECNTAGIVNCAPAASVQIQEQGLDIHIIIWEIRNRDGSSGYVSQYIYDSFQRRDTGVYTGLLSDPFGYYVLIIHTSQSNDMPGKNTYALDLSDQPGFQDAVKKWIASSMVPEEFQNGLIVW
jgi:hypothetical protein